MTPTPAPLKIIDTESVSTALHDCLRFSKVFNKIVHDRIIVNLYSIRRDFENKSQYIMRNDISSIIRYQNNIIAHLLLGTKEITSMLLNTKSDIFHNTLGWRSGLHTSVTFFLYPISSYKAYFCKKTKFITLVNLFNVKQAKYKIPSCRKIDFIFICFVVCMAAALFNKRTSTIDLHRTIAIYYMKKKACWKSRNKKSSLWHLIKPDT